MTTCDAQNPVAENRPVLLSTLTESGPEYESVHSVNSVFYPELSDAMDQLATEDYETGASPSTSMDDTQLIHRYASVADLSPLNLPQISEGGNLAQTAEIFRYLYCWFEHVNKTCEPSITITLIREQLYRLSQFHVDRVDERENDFYEEHRERNELETNKLCTSIVSENNIQEPANVSFPTNDNPTSQILSQQDGDGKQNRLSYDEFGYMIPNAKCDYT